MKTQDEIEELLSKPIGAFKKELKDNYNLPTFLPCWVAVKGTLGQMKAVLEANVPILSIKMDLHNPLHQAYLRRHKGMIELLEAEAPHLIVAKDQEGRMPIYYGTSRLAGGVYWRFLNAIISHHTTVVRHMLRECGVNPNWIHPDTRRSFLYYCEHPPIRLLLLKAGAKVEGFDLAYKVDKGDLTGVKQMLRVRKPNDQASDPMLCIAARGGDKAMIRLLLKAGYKLRADPKGCYPDWHAKTKGHNHLLKLLKREK